MQLEGKLTLIREHETMKSVADIDESVWRKQRQILGDHLATITARRELNLTISMPGVSQTTLGNPGFLPERGVSE